MPIYQYTARDQRGQVSEGQVEADNNGAAVSRLREMGLWVTKLKPVGGSASASPNGDGAGSQTIVANVLFPIWSGVSAKDRSLFYRQIATMLNAGMAIYQALSTLAEQTSNKRLRVATLAMSERTYAGGRVSEAMGQFPWIFTALELRMVEMAEMSGMLVGVLNRLADYLEREYYLRLKIKQRMMYPFILLLAFIFIPDVPILVLQGPGPYFSALARTWVPALVVIVVFFALVRHLLRLEGFRHFYDHVKLAIPAIGPLVRKLAIARFARSFAALYQAGIVPSVSLLVAAETSGNSVLLQNCQRIVPAIERGASLSQCMVLLHFFPPMFTGMVSTGEQTGNMDSMLDKAAEYYENEASHASMQLVVILGVVLLLTMAVFIGAKVVGFYGGYGSAVSSAGGG